MQECEVIVVLQSKCSHDAGEKIEFTCGNNDMLI